MKRIMSVAVENRESRQVWQFFGCTTQGFFMELGANHPTELNQTWFLEQQGWSGILVEPNPDLCELLRAQRPRSRTFQAAAARSLNTTSERWRLFRKMWLNTPFDNGCRKLKQLIRGHSATHQSKS